MRGKASSIHPVETAKCQQGQYTTAGQGWLPLSVSSYGHDSLLHTVQHLRGTRGCSRRRWLFKTRTGLPHLSHNFRVAVRLRRVHRAGWLAERGPESENVQDALQATHACKSPDCDRPLVMHRQDDQHRCLFRRELFSRECRVSRCWTSYILRTVPRN